MCGRPLRRSRAWANTATDLIPPNSVLTCQKIHPQSIDILIRHFASHFSLIDNHLMKCLILFIFNGKSRCCNSTVTDVQLTLQLNKAHLPRRKLVDRFIESAFCPP